MKKLIAITAGVALGVALIVTMAVSMFGCSATRSGRSAQAQRVDSLTGVHVATMLAARLYKIDFDRAYPMTGPSFMLNHPYYISIIGDRVESWLPYFGRAYTIPYGGGEGLRFTATISGYMAVKGAKGQWEVSFEADTAEDSHLLTLEIYPTGEAYLTVNSGQRQSISFSGTIDLDPEFEAIRITD